MFVKIMFWNVQKGKDQTVIYKDLDREIIYNLQRVELMSIPPDEGNDIGKMALVMSFSKGISETIYFPWESPDKVTEIYYMNNEGKTIDRYVY